MARSDRRLIALVVALASPAALACNALLGLSEYEQVECNGGGLCIDAGEPDASEERDAEPDALLPDAGPGTQAVQWAQFRMPNYAQDGGPDANVQSAATYEAVVGGLKDLITERTWESPPNPGLKSWAEAEAYCAAMPGKWRLPSRIELVTLLDLSRDPAIDARFTGTEPSHYWTSSEVRPYGVRGDRQRWTVDFGSGGVGRQNEETGKAAVRCVQAK